MNPAKQTWEKPKKYLGQNFLVQPRIMDKIIRHCQLTKTDDVLEIGPGRGAITRLIAPQVRSMICVEKDKSLAGQLSQDVPGENVTIVEKDFLDFNLKGLPAPIKVIGNLPYNAATLIIERLIEERERFSEFYLMLQKEHAQRMAARPHSKVYGALTCFIQYYLVPKILFLIKPSAFQPQPKVDSAFVHFQIRPEPETAAEDPTFLFNHIIRAAFQQRRKIILNALSARYDKDVLQKGLEIAGIDPKTRAENISLKQFVTLANWLKRERC